MAETEEKTKTKDESSIVNIRDILFICLHRWYWFVISIVLCLGVAMFSILRTQPVYSQSASVLIKETYKGRSLNRSTASFDEFGLFNSNVNVSNEMLTFKSASTIEEVVKRLKLTMNYATPGRFHDITLYGSNLPVQVSLEDVGNNSTAAFDLELLPGGKAKLSEFKLGGEEVGNGKIITIDSFADTLNTPIGRLYISPNSSYSDQTTQKIKVSKLTLNGAVGKYNGKLSVTHEDEESSIIMLRVNDVSIERADDILSCLITVYNENWVRDKNQIAISTSLFIQDRLGIIENDLGNVDSDISSFKSEHLIPDVKSAASMYMTQANEAEHNIIQLNTEVYNARYLRTLLSTEQSGQLIPVGMADGNLASQIQAYNDRLLDRNKLVSASSERNPLVKDYDNELADMRANMIASIDNNIHALEAQINSQQNVGNRATSQIANNPTQAKYLLSVERKQMVMENLYLYLLQKREENELSQAFTAYNTRIIETPGGSHAPISPKRNKILMVAFVIGLLIPLGIIYLRELTNTVVRGRKDIESMSLPFIGELPQSERRKSRLSTLFKKKDTKPKTAKKIVVKEGSRNVINEAFRVVRTNLEFMLGVNGHHVVAITSSNPGSGKTFISFNLSASLALKGKRVIAIDLDLRKGSLSQFADKPKKGISDYLTGRIDDINDIIVKNVEGTNVDIIPVG
ncbi:MAG: AAA family ATPase, partial [Muribaculaceae bacterium]|nr:AAA family ATPase [Muribaculaceae bacterium]